MLSLPMQPLFDLLAQFTRVASRQCNGIVMVDQTNLPGVNAWL